MPKFNIKHEDKVCFSINLDVVWSTSIQDVPSVIAELKKLLD
jgi:uncharacterized protein with HEPN domain